MKIADIIGETIVIGNITVEVNAEDAAKVGFYLDGNLVRSEYEPSSHDEYNYAL